MGKQKVMIFATFVIVLVIVLSLQRQRGDGTTIGPSQVPAVPAQGVGQLRGVALQLHYGDGHPYAQLVEEIAASGANAVCFVVHGYQENASSTSIFIDRRKSPSREVLVALADLAHQRGLYVILMPVVLLENARAGEWRGKIQPTDWAAWWEDYGNFVTYYAKIAAETRTEVFIVGSELVSTEPDIDRWRRLIATVRWLYPGLISYSANWDHYRPIKWWDDVDIIGMTTYYDLTGGAEPTLERLVQAWAPIKKDILQWQSTHYPDKPLLFTEVGWPNQQTCAQYPWNYYAAPDKPDPQAQANCYEAFFETWIREPAVAGFIVWEWRSDPNQLVGPQDTSYTPCGKPAMDVIRRYYAMSAPATGPTERSAARTGR